MIAEKEAVLNLVSVYVHQYGTTSEDKEDFFAILGQDRHCHQLVLMRDSWYMVT